MSMINYAAREINCKIVYLRSRPRGKTTNLEHIYGKVKPETRGKLISLANRNRAHALFRFSSVGSRQRFADSTRAFISTRARPGLLQRQPKLILKNVDGSCSSPTRSSSGWKRISSRCRTCTTTWRNTATIITRIAVCHSVQQARLA
jgi:hypothetical protein